MPPEKLYGAAEVVELVHLSQQQSTQPQLSDSESEVDDLLEEIEDSDGELDTAPDDSDYSPTESNSDEEPSTSSAPPSINKRKRVSVGKTGPAAKTAGKRQQSRKKKNPTEVEEERWHDREEEDITPELPRFMPARTPGPTFDTTRPWSPLELFQLFFSDSVIRKIIANTSANAAKRIRAGVKFLWKPLTLKDFYIFMAIIVFTGLVPLHRRSDYWSRDSTYNFHFPREKMSHNRFDAIMWSLHLSDPDEDEENEKKRNNSGYDRLFKIRPLYDDLVNACMANFQPGQNISIDERMVASKAQISIKQYMKNKPTKWGFKLFVLADSRTGYTWNFSVYTGKSQSSTTTATHGLSYSSVMDLMPLQTLGTGYRLYVDNFYTSPTLFSDLYKKKIVCCGTIRPNHIGYPQTHTNDLSKKAERGDCRWIRHGELLFVNWMDTRKVTMCSTIHQAYSNQSISKKVKEAGVWSTRHIPAPGSVLDYNKYMGGVDLSDALLGYYSVQHKTTKWYKTFFFHFIEIGVVNSYLLLKELCRQRQEKPPSHKQFREKLKDEMLDFSESIADTPSNTQPRTTTCLPDFFDISNKRVRRFCQWCHAAGKSGVRTPVHCTKCNVPLCFTATRNCFKLWHEQ